MSGRLESWDTMAVVQIRTRPCTNKEIPPTTKTEGTRRQLRAYWKRTMPGPIRSITG
jgi:hypothetical protein